MDSRRSPIAVTLNRHHRRLLRHLLVASLATTAGLLLVFCAVVFVPLFIHVTLERAIGPEVRDVARQILLLHEYLWPLVGLCIAGVFLSTWFVHVRMVGPLVRFARVYESLVGGRVPDPISLRAGDYLIEEAAALNRVCTSLGARAARLRALEGDLSDLAAELATSPGTDEAGARLVVLAKRLGDEVDDARGS